MGRTTLPRRVLTVVQEQCRDKGGLGSTYGLTLLGSFSKVSSLRRTRCRTTSILLTRFAKEGVGFSFCGELSQQLMRGCRLCSGVCIRRQAGPGGRIILRCDQSRSKRRFRRISVPGICTNVFIRAFIMFFKRRVRCCVARRCGGGIISARDGHLAYGSVCTRGSRDECGLVGRVLVSRALSSRISVFRAVGRCTKCSRIAGGMFGLLWTK